MARGGGGDGEATHARHSVAVLPFIWPVAPPARGGSQKSRAAPGAGPRSLTSTGFFLVLGISERLGRDCGCSRAGTGQPIRRGLRPPNRRVALLPQPRQLVLGVIAGRVCDHAQGPDCRRIIFPFSGLLSGSNVLQGNNGNLGTYHIRQAESLAFGGCQPVPKPSGRFGNMGTEMADPNALDRTFPLFLCCKNLFGACRERAELGNRIESSTNLLNLI